MFRSVTLYTNKLEAMQSFYTTILALPLIEQAQQQFTVQIGSSCLTFKRASQSASYHFAFNLPGNQIPAAKTWVQNRVNLNIENGKDEIYYKNFNADAIYFEDPAGNVVEFIGRRHRQREGAFSSSSFLNISEASVTTPFVSDVGKALQTEGIPVLREAGIDPEGLNFLGVGDCFIILVPPNRRWYFSTHLSGTFPLELTLQNGKTLVITEKGEMKK